MFEARKNGFPNQSLSNDVQAAAFRNNGWEIATIQGKVSGGSDELTELRAEADALQIKYHPNTGAEKLREKIAEAKTAALAAEGNQ